MKCFIYSRKNSLRLTRPAAPYLRCIDGWAEARVVPFIVDSGGGSSDTQNGGSNVDDSQVATDEEIDQLLDNIFG